MLRTERSQNLALIALGIVVFSLFALIISFSSSKDVPVTQEQPQASENTHPKTKKVIGANSGGRRRMIRSLSSHFGLLS
jgi:hypothetical protein